MLGRWKAGVPVTYMDAKIFMVHGTTGQQCGHCGKYGGNRATDEIYEQTGKLKVAGDIFCDTDVSCRDRVISGGVNCQGNAAGQTFTLADCPQFVRTKADCKKFEEDIDPTVAGKVPMAMEHGELDDCIIDACLDKRLVDDDAADAAEEDAAEAKMKAPRRVARG